MSDRVDPLIGAVLNETFRVTQKLGEGGMGAVYKAEHLRLPRPFAIKIIHESVDPNSEFYHRFRREADVCSRLRHEHIVEVVDFNFTPAGQPYIAMEYLEGEDLGERLERDGKFSLADTVDIVGQICAALTEAHSQSVVHRDLKPQNIFLCKRRNTNNYVKLLDFGISKIQGSDSMLTGTNAMMGTPYYMSPEQTGHGDAVVTDRSDLYALAVITYQMLTNKYAISGDNIAQIVMSIITVRPPSLNTYAPSLPPAVDAVVQCGLAKDPAERFESAEAFGNALQLAVGGSVPSGIVEATGPVPVATPSGGFDSTLASVPPVTPVAMVAPSGGFDSTVAYGTDPALVQSQSTTLSGAASELGAASESHGSSKLPLVVAGGLVVLVVAALGAWFALGPKSDEQKKPRSATTAPAPPEQMSPSAPASVTPPMTGAPAIVPITPKIKVPEGRVIIRLLDLPSAATCKVDGKTTRDNPLVVKKSTQSFRLECTAEGFESFSTALKPDRDLGLRVNMKKVRRVRGRRPRVRTARKTDRRPMVRRQPPRVRPMRRGRTMRPVDDDVPIE